MYLALALFLVLLLILGLVSWTKRKKIDLLESDEFLIPEITLSPPPHQLKPPYLFENQIPEVQELLSELKDLFKDRKVTHLYLINGTFAGHDPLGVIKFIEHYSPQLAGRTENLLKTFYQTKMNKIDFGHFPIQFVHFLATFLADTTKVHLFSWSSENHHMARIRAALELLAEIANHSPIKDERILFLTHSHGGQLLAILQLMRARPEFVDFLKSHLPKESLHSKYLEFATRENLNRNLDIFTLGTPVRYPFYPYDGEKLLHLVNFRKASTGIPIKGILRARDGDYIYRLGIAGSDAPAITKTERDLNRKLDSWLDQGRNIKKWKANLTKGFPLHPLGERLLVDYQDGHQALPLGVKSFWGHVIYNQSPYLLSLLEWVNTRLYK